MKRKEVFFSVLLNSVVLRVEWLMIGGRYAADEGVGVWELIGLDWIGFLCAKVLC